MLVIWCLSYSYRGDSGASVWVWENVNAYVISILVADSLLLNLVRVETVWICVSQRGEYSGEVVYGLVQVNVRQR